MVSLEDNSVSEDAEMETKSAHHGLKAGLNYLQKQAKVKILPFMSLSLLYTYVEESTQTNPQRERDCSTLS